MQNLNDTNHAAADRQTAVFGGGCFWCTEAVFTAMKGVLSVQSGYCGGSVQNPTYEQVCGKETGHIEVVKIEFDAQQTDFSALLEVFFATHDPTTPGRQGNDVGPQYQSAVFYQDAAQHEAVKQYIKHLEASGAHDAPVCTELHAAAKFWPAEQYHADYFALHPEQGYCQFVIAPKVQKFRKQFSAKLKG